ncbi:MAG: hypothetical protein H0T54_06835 [Geodermatophilaceae bacterium]|nr:hypothetical protein [Geodermatophilaceae bacterium]
MSPATSERGFLSFAVSLGVILTAFFVFLWAGRDQALGPLDLETAHRLALALWVAAPIAGGIAGRHSENRGLIRGALSLCLIVGLTIALFPGSGTGEYACWLNLPAVPLGYPLGRLAVGSLVGAGVAIGLLVTGLSTRRLSTAVPGIVLAAAINLCTSVAASELFYGGVRCLQ